MYIKQKNKTKLFEALFVCFLTTGPNNPSVGDNETVVEPCTLTHAVH